MEHLTTLDKLEPGQKARVMQIHTAGAMKRRFMDLGLIKNTQVECLGRSPLGDPSAYLIRGTVIAIRAEDCRQIFVEPAERERKYDGKTN